MKQKPDASCRQAAAGFDVAYGKPCRLRDGLAKDEFVTKFLEHSGGPAKCCGYAQVHAMDRCYNVDLQV